MAPQNKGFVLAPGHHNSRSANRCRRGRSAIRKKLYKSSIQRAKTTIRIKMRKIRLANMTEEKRVMAVLLGASRRDAAEAEERLRLAERSRNRLMDERNGVIILFMLLRALEDLLMLVLGF